MKILIVGANGLLGSGAVAALSDGNEIIQASRTGDVSVDLRSKINRCNVRQGWQS